ncbi:MAG: 2OG-Fe(II) oxygenase [Cyclobacteriaceae bacterium]|nr:2OG-Fe(II) oxygenase [Cyclobacteriaceae bacterium]
MQRFRDLQPGEPMPHFSALGADGRPVSSLGFGGGYLLLFLPGPLEPAQAQTLRREIAERAPLFQSGEAQFLACVPEGMPSPCPAAPGMHLTYDPKLRVARLLGGLATDGQGAFRPRAVLVDPMLRIIDTLAAATEAERGQAFDLLASQPPAACFAGLPLRAPVLVLPRVFPPDLCTQLIAAHKAHGGQASGVMRLIDGKTVGVHDPQMKVRRDHLIEDSELIIRIQNRIRRTVLPEIRKVHAFEVTRMERYVVGCYRAEDKGHFAAHRDNTTPATAHRRFAISITLNDDYEGGEISFPEYNPEGLKPPVGAAIVFSCALLHRVAPVTRGTRYVFLPFVYDEAAAKRREAQPAASA